MLEYQFALQSQTINHFARKFEPLINQEIINMVDEWLYGTHPENMPGRLSYWENFYHSKTDPVEKFDIYLTFLSSFARIASNALSLSSGCRYTPIWKPTEGYYYQVKDKLEGVLTTFSVKVATDDIKREFLTVETHLKQRDSMTLFNGNLSSPANRLQSLSVSGCILFFFLFLQYYVFLVREHYKCLRYFLLIVTILWCIFYSFFVNYILGVGVFPALCVFLIYVLFAADLKILKLWLHLVKDKLHQ